MTTEPTRPLPVPSEIITGYPIATLDRRATTEHLMRWIDDPSSVARYFVCANPHSLEVARRDEEFDQALRSADLVTADGVGIVLASRLLEGRIRERVCGPDIFTDLCKRLAGERPGTRMFFLGTDADNLDRLAERFQRDFPRLVIAGSLAPPFRDRFSDAEDAEMIARINAARTDILWIGLGAPKQEKWAHRHRERVAARVIAPIGGAFDWYTGRVRLPPPWMQRAGLQWLHRLAQDPRRLWRRNLDSPLFLARVLRQRYSPTRDTSGAS